MQHEDSRPNFDLTVRVGCSLVYEVTGTASLLLKVRLRENPGHSVLFQALTLGDDLPVEEFSDSHGNAACRVKLAPGTNCFRHDAIVAVSSIPDNNALAEAVPQIPGDIPAPLLRYTLPRRARTAFRARRRAFRRGPPWRCCARESRLGPSSTWRLFLSCFKLALTCFVDGRSSPALKDHQIRSPRRR